MVSVGSFLYLGRFLGQLCEARVFSSFELKLIKVNIRSFNKIIRRKASKYWNLSYHHSTYRVYDR